MYIPSKIKKHLVNQKYTIDKIGASIAKVLIYQDYVLKIKVKNNDVDLEYQKMLDFKDLIPIPQVVEYVTGFKYTYLLMTRIKGINLTNELILTNPSLLTTILKKAINILQKVDINKIDQKYNSIEKQLSQAKYNLDHNLIDLNRLEKDTLSPQGFPDLYSLYTWLVNNKPQPELSFIHGDLCLPNIIYSNNDVYFIDIGDARIGDKWLDLALCYRSIKHNIDGTYGKKYDMIDPLQIFKELGININYEKIKYYILLDEFF